jgi:hypothetical protein
MTIDEYLREYGRGPTRKTRIVDGVLFYEVHPTKAAQWWVAGKGDTVVTVAAHDQRYQVAHGGRAILSLDRTVWFTSLASALHAGAAASIAIRTTQ